MIRKLLNGYLVEFDIADADITEMGEVDYNSDLPIQPKSGKVCGAITGCVGKIRQLDVLVRHGQNSYASYRIGIRHTVDVN